MHYRLGDYTLNTQRYELSRHNSLQKLQPKVFDLLVYLIQNHQRVVSRQELFDTLWPETVVGHDALEWVIAAARRAVGDDGRAQRVIKTIRGRGYRVVAAVEALPSVRPDEGWPPVLAWEAVDRAAVLPSVDGERKLVTVIACTLFPTNQGASEIDPETLYTVYQEVFSLTRQEVERYEGTLQPFFDNMILAFFGLPFAQEDHAQRAVLAAQRLRECLREADAALGPGTKEAWAPCLGLHTGEVVVGAIADDPRQMALAGGHTTQMAAQLARLADPGAILLSSATAQLARHLVRLDPVDSLSMPVGTASQTIYRVLEQRASTLPLRWQGRWVRRHFVGRASELATLKALLAQAEAGHGQVAGIAGEPGIGKSRLLDEFRQQVPQGSFIYLTGGCVSYGQATPYLPLLDLVHQAFGLSASDPPDAAIVRVKQYLQTIGMTPAASAPYVLRLLNLPDGEDRLPSLSPQMIRKRIFDTLLQIQLYLSRQQPLVIEIENVHWIDPTSEEWLAALVDRLASASILLLLSYRPGYQPPWMGKSYATQLALQPLLEHESRQLVQAVLPTQVVSDALVGAIVEKGEGNPFFLEELAQAAVDQGVMDPALSVPQTVQAVLSARLDRLPPETKTLLQMAAVIGTEMPGPLLQAMTALPETALDAHLARLQEAELFYENHLAPEPLYAFKHALTQGVAYHSLLRRTRQRYHQQIAETLVERFADIAQTRPAVLAHHYTEAGLTEQAILYWQQAGQHALERSACKEALVHLTTGLDLLQTLPPTQEHMARELDLQLHVKNTLTALEGYAAPVLERTLLRAQELGQTVGSLEQHLDVLNGLGTLYRMRHEIHKARAVAEQGIRLALQSHNPLRRLVFHYELGEALYFAGDLVTAQSHLEQALTFFDPHWARQWYLWDPRVQPFSLRALVLSIRGYPEQARQSLHQALAIAHQGEYLMSLGVALNQAATFYSYRREWRTAQEYAETLLTLATDHGLQLLAARAMWLRGAALVQQGRHGDGMAQLLQGLTALQDRELPTATMVTLLAEAYGKVGQVREGLELVNDTLVQDHDNGYCLAISRLYGLKSEFLLTLPMDHQTDAENCLHEAITTARHQQAKMWELRAATSLARLWLQQGKRKHARDLLTPVYAWFTEGLDTLDLQDAKHLLLDLSSTP